MKKVLLTLLLITNFLSLTGCSIVGISVQEKADKFEIKYRGFAEEFRRGADDFISNPTEESAKQLNNLNSKKNEWIQEVIDITKEAQNRGEVISIITISGLRTITNSIKETSTAQREELEENMDKFKNVIAKELYSDLKTTSEELINEAVYLLEELEQ